jgi:hypothetical protein
MGVMLPAPAAPEAPFAFDTTPGRLPKNVIPIDYQIADAYLAKPK